MVVLNTINVSEKNRKALEKLSKINYKFKEETTIKALGVNETILELTKYFNQRPPSDEVVNVVLVVTQFHDSGIRYKELGGSYFWRRFEGAVTIADTLEINTSVKVLDIITNPEYSKYLAQEVDERVDFVVFLNPITESEAKYICYHLSKGISKSQPHALYCI